MMELTGKSVFYRCERAEGKNYGINDDGVIITGLALVPYLSTLFDYVEDDVSNLGSDASLIIPDEVVEGVIYEAFMVNMSRDWESGHVEDWDIELKPVTDPAMLAEIEVLKVECERIAAEEDSRSQEDSLTLS